MTARRNRILSVRQKQRLSPNMIRILLGGEALKDFPAGYESGYVKLLLPVEQKILKRSYTIRHFDQKNWLLTLDFVVHVDTIGSNGPASNWALNCREGDTVTVDGPGAAKLVDLSADWFLLAGDMAALPAISVNLERLPTTAKGYAVVEVMDSADKLPLAVPSGIALHWVINPKPDQANTLLVDAVTVLPWLCGKAGVWSATEFESMRRLRRYFKQEQGLSSRQVYVSSYWKMGEADEGHKRAKKSDTETIQ
ncbi:MAG: NADPH-dependent ferric siderophore reductase [Cellvibrionaceae bacterium]